MKRRSTTPVSKGLVTKSAIVAVAVVMVMAGPLSMMPKAHADQYDDQINALQQQADQYQAQANQKQKEADTLAGQLQQLAAQRSALQTQIDLSQAQYDKLQNQIKETQQKIADNKDALGTTMADMYVDGTISPLEMLASSNNIGDYVDKQTYQTSVRDTLSQTIQTINDLKAKLEKDQASVKTVLDKQNAQKNSLVAVENQQQALLNKTKGEEATYQKLVAQTKSQLEEASAAQRAAIARLGSSGSFGGYVGADVSGVTPQSSFDYRNWTGNSPCGSGGYPFCGAQDSYADDWSLFNRECVSYAAWKASATGHNVPRTSEGGGFHGHGMAYEFASSAKGWLGATVDNNPAPGAVAILPPVPGFAPVGHAMFVESVSGNWAHVSQYNFDGTGEYSEMDILTTGVIYVHFH